MSTRDHARLSAHERAVLAALEARAAAEDPQLAARLRGSPFFRLRLSRLRVPALPRPLRSRWWGVPMVLAGLFLVLLGVTSSVVLATFGALLVTGGLHLVFSMLRGRFVKLSEEASASA